MHQYSVIITNKYEFFYSPVIGSENFLFSTGITITKDTCTSHQIRKVDIENVLLYMIQQVTAFAREHEDEFIELVTKSNAKSVGVRFVKVKRNLNKLKPESASWILSFKDSTRITSKAKSVMSVS